MPAAAAETTGGGSRANETGTASVGRDVRRASELCRGSVRCRSSNPSARGPGIILCTAAIRKATTVTSAVGRGVVCGHTCFDANRDIDLGGRGEVVREGWGARTACRSQERPVFRPSLLCPGTERGKVQNVQYFLDVLLTSSLFVSFFFFLLS